MCRFAQRLAVILAGVVCLYAGASWAQPRRRAPLQGRSLSSGDKYKARGVEHDLKAAKQKLAQGKTSIAADGLERAKREIDGLALKYGEDHPEVQRLRALYEEASPEIMSAEKERKGAETQRRAQERESRVGKARSGPGLPEKGMRAFGGSIRTTIESAKKHSDRVELVPKENQKQNNFRIAMDELRKASEAIADLGSRAGADNPGLAELKAFLEEVRAEFNAKHGARLQAYYAGVPTPQNLYKGSDREELEGRVRNAYMKARPQDRILGIRFDQAQWVRGEAKTTDSEMVSSNAHLITETYTAEETLRVSVVVQSSERLATIYYMYPRRDLHSGGQSMGGPYFGREMLLANFK